MVLGKASVFWVGCVCVWCWFFPMLGILKPSWEQSYPKSKGLVPHLPCLWLHLPLRKKHFSQRSIHNLNTGLLPGILWNYFHMLGSWFSHSNSIINIQRNTIDGYLLCCLLLVFSVSRWHPDRNGKEGGVGGHLVHFLRSWREWSETCAKGGQCMCKDHCRMFQGPKLGLPKVCRSGTCDRGRMWLWSVGVV